MKTSIQPFEVSYRTAGRNKTRNVIGVLCPTAMAQYMGIAKPIFVSLGDIEVDWECQQSEGYRAMFSNIGIEQ